MDEIYDAYYYKIYFWSLKKTKNKEDAEDLTNNVFLAIFKYFDKDIEINKIDNLIWKIAYNLWCTKAKKYIKEKNNVLYEEGSYQSNQYDNLDKIIYNEIVDNLDDIGMTEKEISSFKLYYIDDLSIKEISRKFSVSESNIKYYLFSARKKIKEKYYE